MSIENIIKKIEQERKATVEEILGKAGEEAEAIKREYAREGEKLKEQLEDEARKKGEDEKKRIIVNEQLKMRKSMLSKKQQVLNSLYLEAREKIASLPGEEYLELVRGLILSRSSSGKEKIIIPRGQGDMFGQDFISSLNRDYQGDGKFSLAEQEGDFRWGVILREERRTVNLTLDVIFEQLKESIEPQVAGILFPPEEQQSEQ